MAVVAVVVAAFLAAGWAWRYQHQVLRVIHPVAVGRPARSGPDIEVGPAAPRRRPPHVSVLGWESFTVTSVLTLDDTVLIGCHRRGQCADDVRTLVLRIGTDGRSAQAIAMLERWQARRATLRLRPTDVAGAIELREGARAILRAPLLAT